MLGNDTMETASTEVTSIRHWNDIEKSTWKTHRYFVNFESRVYVEISMLNRCHNFHVDSPFKVDVISMNFPCRIWTWNWWRIHKDVSIGLKRGGKSVALSNLSIYYTWKNIKKLTTKRACSLVVSNLRSETTGSRFESGC